jgi:hypothetical protein
LNLNYYGNFSVHLGDGVKVNRFIGPFMDPLATAFFVVPLLCYYYVHNNPLKNKVLFFLLLLLLLLTITKAIILGTFVILFLVRKKKKEYKSYMFLVFIAIPIMAIVLALFYDKIIHNVDPSTYGHLYAYYSNINAFIQNPFGYGYFRYAENLPILFKSTETIFFSVLLEQGIFAFFIFIAALITTYRYLSARINLDKNVVVVYCSFNIYILASFTTEHFLAITSSLIFWILLGHLTKSSSFQEYK